MEFEVDGIKYKVNKDGRTASVISNNYEGELAIPDSVEYNGNKYSVTAIGGWALSGCSGLTSVVIPVSVTAIGDGYFGFRRGAFGGCSGLESIVVEKGNPVYDSRDNCNAIIETKTNKLIVGCKNTIIPYSVTEIGDGAFGGCSGLTGIVIPDTVVEIGGGAFGGCSGLESIVVENGNQVYDSRDNCNAIVETKTNKLLRGCKNTVIPDSVTSIGNGAFGGCCGLTSIVIPNSVAEIGGSAFGGCSGLTSIVIPDSVAKIGDYAFASCSDVESVVIPNSVSKIGKEAFSGCIGLTSVVIPNSATEIGERAFHGCSGLTSVVIPDSVTKIGDSAFHGCSGLTSVVIPDSVTKIGDSAFWGCSALRSVFIPSSVTEIGNSVFSGCGGLTSVVIPNSVTAIGDRAFYGCRGLASVVIPDSVTEIGERAFSCCSGLESIIVGNGNPVYDSRDNCNAIIETEANKLIIGCKSTIIPDSVTEIGDCAFDGCSGLRSGVIPDSVTAISSWAFDGCSGLESMVVEKGNPEYDSRDNCNAIIGTKKNELIRGCKNSIIPDSITAIGGSSFYGCSGLTSVVIPDSVTYIDEIDGFAFGGCSGLESIVVEKGNQVYDSRDNCNAIIETKTNKLISGCKSTIIPDSVTAIGEGGFYGCSGLTSIVIPDLVTEIGWDAFKDCSGLSTLVFNAESCQWEVDVFSACNNLNTILVGRSVKCIPEELINMASLRNVIVLAQEPPKCKASVSKNITVHVPKEAYVKYWLDDYWRNFNLCELIPVSEITLSHTNAFLGLNYKDNIHITVLPTNATHKEVIWRSDNPEVVTVDQSGIIKGVSKGTANIIVEVLDGSGVKAMCKVRVGEILAESVIVTPGNLRLERHKVADINCRVLPENAHNKAVEWSATNAGVVAFRKNSKGSISVIGVSAGSAKILCKALDGGGACGVCDITVENR